MIREYRVYHKNSETRSVAVTDVVERSIVAALHASMEWAVHWNLTETRENMITRFLECEGKTLAVKATLFTAQHQGQMELREEPK